MLYPLVDRQDREVATPAQSAMPQELLQAAQDLRVAVRIHPDAADEITTGQGERIARDGLAGIFEQGAPFFAQMLQDAVDRQCAHAGFSILIVPLTQKTSVSIVAKNRSFPADHRVAGSGPKSRIHR